MVCRPPGGKDNAKIDVIQEIQDEEVSASILDTRAIVSKWSQKETDHYACAWSKDPKTGTPWLCVAGGSDKVKVFNAVTGDLLRVSKPPPRADCDYD